MKKTAVQRLELSLLGIISFDSEELRAKYKQRILEAKEIEKQQIIDARVNGMCAGIDISDKSIDKDLSHTHEQYYNETFKKE